MIRKFQIGQDHPHPSFKKSKTFFMPPKYCQGLGRMRILNFKKRNFNWTVTSMQCDQPCPNSRLGPDPDQIAKKDLKLGTLKVRIFWDAPLTMFSH